MNVTLSGRFSVYSFLKNQYQVIVFAIYLVLLATAVGHHEPWMDEAQAWLLAKDLSFKELFVKYLRYEGSPGLWHLILMVPAKLGLPYFTINILSASISALGVWLFIRYAPFPVVIKVLYPFSFFVFFQYGIVARSYCLIAPVLFLLAINFGQRKERPYIFTGLLCLLANISIHTFIIAGSFAFLHFIEVLKQWKTMDSSMKKHQAISLLIFGLMSCIVIFIVMTPSDQTFAGYSNWDPINFIEISKRMIGGSLVMSEFNQLPWLYGTASFAIFIITLQWLFRSKMLSPYLLPLFLLSALFAIKYRSPWHQGILLLLWLFVLWISFDEVRKSLPGASRAAINGVLGIVLAVQVFWCAEALRYDLYQNYSGSYNLAKYIKANHLQNGKIYASGWRTISILPYFQQNIFYNHNNGSSHRFWNWSTNNVTPVGASPGILDTIECEQPDLVIFASDHIPSQEIIDLPGYRAVKFFSGYLCWKTGLIEPECYLVFRKRRQEPEKIVYVNKEKRNKRKNLE